MSLELTFGSPLIHVSKGVKRLHMIIPGWAQYVDLNTLDMESRNEDVLGQIMQNHPDLDAYVEDQPYVSGIVHVFPEFLHKCTVPVQIRSYYGFTAYGSYVDYSFEDLTRVWKRVIPIYQREVRE